MRAAIAIGLTLALTGCSSAKQPALNHAPARAPQSAVNMPAITNGAKLPANHPAIAAAEQNATPAARNVMRQTRKMALAGTLIKGACWDYLNAAWNIAGVPAKKRQHVFKSKKSGPYADSNQIQAGDWLYYVNHSYNNIEHSGMFIGWTNRARKEALIFSYAGEHRKEPARYRVYHIDQVYTIIRAK